MSDDEKQSGVKTKWHVHAVITGGKYIGSVMAETKEEAMDAGIDLPNANVDLCSKCNVECHDATISEFIVEPDDGR